MMMMAFDGHANRFDIAVDACQTARKMVRDADAPRRFYWIIIKDSSGVRGDDSHASMFTRRMRACVCVFYNGDNTC